MQVDPDAAEVRAAGGVVWRREREGVRIAVVHRPRYDDWSLPKGKLDPGEDWQQAAVREVHEELGVRCAPGRELAPIGYTDHRGRRKAVRYWLMESPEPAAFEPNDEVDEVLWLDGPAARERLSYPPDREVLDEALSALRASVTASGP